MGHVGHGEDQPERLKGESRRSKSAGNALSAIIWVVNVEVGPADAEQIVVAPAVTPVTKTADSVVIDWGRAARAFALALAAFVVFVASAGISYDLLHAGKFIPGVDVGGVDVSGLTRHQAAAVLRAELPNPQAGALKLQLGTSTATIAYSDIDRQYAMEQMLDGAAGVGGGVAVVDQIRALNHGVSVPLYVTWNHDALATAIRAVVGEANEQGGDAAVGREGATYVARPAVAGITFDAAAAYEAAASAIADPSTTNPSITVEPTTTAPAVDTAAAQQAIDSVERIAGSDLTLSSNGQSLTIPSAVLRGWVHLVPVGAGQWDVAIPEEPVAQYVDQLKALVDVAPVNASFAFEGRRAVVVDGQDGQQIDSAPAVAAAVDALRSRDTGAGSASSVVNFSVVPVSPEFTGTDAAAIVDRVKRLGRWTTRFTVSPFNGNGVNIERPARLVNGTVVQPGEMFDFIDVAGPFNRGNGYTDGAAIQGGRTRLDGVLGGGLCSASTTLFNAAARAGLQIDERHNHSYYIDRYPVGLDATIWMNGSIRKSFRFTNDTAYPILIRGYYSPGRVTFEIWGVPDGREVAVSRADVQDEKPGANFIVYTDSLPAGVTEQVEFKATGFESTVIRTVRDANGTLLHEDTFYSDYIKVDGIYRVGRYPGDPRDGTKIPASEYVRSGPPTEG